MTNYCVVAFTHENPLAHNNYFHNEGVQLIKASVQKLRGLSRERLQNLEQAVVYTLLMLPPHLRQQYRDMGISAADAARTQQQATLEMMLNPPTEYEQYDQVHFLNEIAVRMTKRAASTWKYYEPSQRTSCPQVATEALAGLMFRIEGALMLEPRRNSVAAEAAKAQLL